MLSKKRVKCHSSKTMVPSCYQVQWQTLRLLLVFHSFAFDGLRAGYCNLSAEERQLPVTTQIFKYLQIVPSKVPVLQYDSFISVLLS